MKKLIIIRGPLGVGKTTVSKILAQDLEVEYISLDQIIDDHKLVAPDADGIPLETFLKVNDIIHDIANKNKKTFIIDGCFFYQEQINDLKNKFNNDVEIFTLTTDVEQCIERDSQRKIVFGEDSARYVHMVTTEIQAGYEIDNTNLTVQETVEKIMKKIENLNS